MDIHSNIIAFNEASDVENMMVGSSDSFEGLHHNLFWLSDGSSGYDSALGEGDLVADPRLVDDPNDGGLSDDDYHLRDSSPAIDAGPSDAALADVDGSRNDLGMYGGPEAQF